MASSSPPFELEDQTDEDFFDKLVNDDDDDEIVLTGSRLGVVEVDDDSDELKAFADLSISEVDPTVVDADAASVSGNVNAGIEGEKGSQDGVVLESIEETGVANKSDSVIPGNVNNESSEVGMGEEGALSSGMDKSSVESGTGVKEVQWSAFNSDSDIHSGSGFGSYFDIFKELRDDSEDPFATVGEKDDFGDEFNALGGVLRNSVADLSSSSYGQTHEGQYSGVGAEQNVNEQGLSSSQYLENLYPGWRCDPNTGQWHQLDGYDENVSANTTMSADANAHESFVVSNQSANDRVVVSDQRSDVYYLQQTAQSVAGSVAEGCTTASVTNLDQSSQGNAEYPAHMVFDPQFPGWYYDTITQDWKSLESYTPDVNQLAGRDYNQQYQSTNIESYGSQGLGSQDQFTNWGGSVSNYNQQNMATWQAQPIAKIETTSFTERKHIRDPYGSTSHLNNLAEQHTGFKPSVSVGGSVSNYNQQNTAMWQAQPFAKIETTGFTDKKHIGDPYGSTGQVNNFAEQHTGFKPSGSIAPHEQASWSVDHNNGASGFQSFIPTEQFSQHHNKIKMETSQQMHFKPSYLDSQNSVSFSQQPFQSGTRCTTSEGRSSAGRPPHTLVTFGFGGKLIVMKNDSYFQSNMAYGNQDSVQGVVNVHNLMEVVTDKTDASSFGLGSRDYFHALCQQSFPGPLVGGNVGNKELNKWVDDRIVNCESPYMDYRNGEVSRLLFSLLKIACQYYGKLRSPFGTDQALKGSDSPEPAVANLFASAKINGVQSSEYGALMHCLQNMPSEAQIQATALEVQKHLVSGKKKEALQCALEGQLWGPALVLATQLGDQFYGDTVKQMALKQLVAGSPLRTLCLLIAGQPADIFSSSSATTSSTLPGSVIISQPPAQIGSNFMLDKWKENLAIITANRTKDDELVIVHLGDCLWKERGEVTAAHTCYLVADANFEPYSDSARLCLIGADHLKFPRTYASPEAIQRTELYEYSKVLGNSQFLLLPFQPYKLIYAHMLAEVGKIADSLKYCQAILKSLKTGRAPEVDTWKQLVLSLEERLKTHQQGGYSTNLAPTKLVGKLLTFFDSTAHRVVGGLPPPPPPPVPSTSHSSVQYNELAHQQGDPKVSNSQSTMAMSSLMPSASMEPISGWTGETNQLAMPNRSISEPDFGRSPRKVGSSKEANSSDTREKVPVSGGSSRFGRFGSQLFQKTVGLVLRSRPDKQAKLGEKNRFYYDEKLKRWVEEGAEPPAEEAALPPPPTTAAFQNGMPDHNIKDAPKIEDFQTNIGLENKSPISSEQSSGIPPIPPSSNQFSARGRMGVRSRYVDTFNKGGGSPTNLFQSPSVPAAKPVGASNPKFFIPTPVASGEETVQTTGESVQETIVTNENPLTSLKEDSFSSPPPSTSSSSSSVTMQRFHGMGPPSSSPSPSMTMQRFPSMDNIAHKRTGALADGNDALHSDSRRTVSWSGGISDACNPSLPKDIKPLGEALSMPDYTDSKLKRFSTNGSNFGDDLHEVEI